MKRQKIHLAVFLVGQPELVEKKNFLEESGRYEIIGRFMNEEFQFHGIRSKDEMAIILHTYDENTEFPNGTGCSYTEYFFPEAFNLDWRIENETDNLFLPNEYLILYFAPYWEVSTNRSNQTLMLSKFSLADLHFNNIRFSEKHLKLMQGALLAEKECLRSRYYQYHPRA